MDGGNDCANQDVAQVSGEGNAEDAVKMKDFHFTNGDWIEKEKPKPQIMEQPEELPKEGSGENIALDNNALADSDDDRRSISSGSEYGSDGQKLSYFDKLLREVAQIKYTPEEDWELKNEGHRERNKMLLDGVKRNHRDWIYLYEEKIALEHMWEEKKARLAAKKEAALKD